jgi:hypothetical protein
MATPVVAADMEVVEEDMEVVEDTAAEEEDLAAAEEVTECPTSALVSKNKSGVGFDRILYKLPFTTVGFQT